MKQILLIATVTTAVLSFVILGLIAKSGDDFEQIKGEHQLFSVSTGETIELLSSAHKLAIWPKTETGKNVVEKSRIPQEVLSKAEVFVRDVLKKEFIPQNLSSWWIGIESEYDDELWARYTTKDNLIIQIVETGPILSFLFKKTEVCFEIENTQENEIANAVISFANIVFNLPEDKLNTVNTATKTSKAENGKKIVWGVISIPEEGISFENTHWWEKFTYWTDGEVFYFHIIKRGKPEFPLGAHPGGRNTRFIPKK